MCGCVAVDWDEILLWCVSSPVYSFVTWPCYHMFPHAQASGGTRYERLRKQSENQHLRRDCYVCPLADSAIGRCDVKLAVPACRPQRAGRRGAASDIDMFRQSTQTSTTSIPQVPSHSQAQVSEGTRCQAAMCPAPALIKRTAKAVGSGKRVRRCEAAQSLPLRLAASQRVQICFAFALCMISPRRPLPLRSGTRPRNGIEV